MNNTPPLILLTSICKTYWMGGSPVHALQNIALTIQQGEYIAILGRSGSGKSTLMNILGCLDTPTSGHYYLKGEDVSYLGNNAKAKVRNYSIGFIFQSFNLLEYGSALDNVTLPLVYRGTRAHERVRRAKDVLTRLGLAERMHHHPNELSGGQKQRVAIARALVTDPDIILADEPTGNLDSHSGQNAIHLFEALIRQGKTIIMVTHDLEVAKRAHRIIHIQDGCIIPPLNS